MAHRDFRGFLAALEQQALLRRIDQPVDASWEPASIAKWMFQALPEEQRFGLLFEDVQGADYPLITAAIGASRKTYAVALDVEPTAIGERWQAALANPRAPRVINEAPCQQVVRTDALASLANLPIPVWTPGKDAAPYITTAVVNREATTGAQNIGVYRTMVRDQHHVVCNLNPGRQGYQYAASYLNQDEPAPIAWVVAAEPVVHLASVANMPPGYDEIRVAGGLKGEGIELVRCKTIDLLVPAQAQIVIEGQVLPGETAQEGPFGEFAGYMGPVAPKPVVRITAITHREDAVYYGLSSQMPPSESTIMQSLSNGPVFLKMLHERGETAVSDIHIDQTFGGLLAHAIVAVTRPRAGDARRIGRLLAETSPLKRITLVDDSVDPRDSLHVEWALNAHYDPARDTEVIPDVSTPLYMDPSVRRPDGTDSAGSKIVVDATQTVDAGTYSLPSADIMANALKSWQKFGLPEFEIPERARRRIERS